MFVSPVLTARYYKYGDGVNQTYCGDHLKIYTAIKTLCCTPEVNYMSIMLQFLKERGGEAEGQKKEDEEEIAMMTMTSWQIQLENNNPQAYLRDTVGLVPGHHNKETIAVKQVTQNFWLPGVYENYVILHCSSLLSVYNHHVQKYLTLIGK